MEYSIGLAENTEDKQGKAKEKEEDEDEDLGHLDIAEQILNNNKQDSSNDESDDNSRPISEGEK